MARYLAKKMINKIPISSDYVVHTDYEPAGQHGPVASAAGL